MGEECRSLPGTLETGESVCGGNTKCGMRNRSSSNPVSVVQHPFGSSDFSTGIECGLQFWSGVFTHFGGLGRPFAVTIVGGIGILGIDRHI